MGYQYISGLIVCVVMATLIQNSQQVDQALGTACTVATPDTCADAHSTCVDGVPCACDAGYYDDNGATAAGTCVIKPALGAACSATIPCADANAQTCTATLLVCTCATTHPINTASPPVCVAAGSGNTAKSSLAMLTATMALLLRWFLNL